MQLKNSGNCSSDAVSAFLLTSLCKATTVNPTRTTNYASVGTSLVVPAGRTRSGFPSMHSMQMLPCCARLSTCTTRDCTPGPPSKLTPVFLKYLRVSSSWVAIMPLPPKSSVLIELLSSQTSMHTRTPSLAFFTSNSPASKFQLSCRLDTTTDFCCCTVHQKQEREVVGKMILSSLTCCHLGVDKLRLCTNEA